MEERYKSNILYSGLGVEDICLKLPRAIFFGKQNVLRCESHVMVRRTLIQDVKDHRRTYTQIYGSDDYFNYILNGLHPPQNSSGIAFDDKWLMLPDMGHMLQLITIGL